MASRSGSIGGEGGKESTSVAMSLVIFFFHFEESHEGRGVGVGKEEGEGLLSQLEVSKLCNSFQHCSCLAPV